MEAKGNAKEAVRKLVIALLAVNSYPIEKVFSCSPKLEEEGVFAPEKVSSWTEEDAVRRLARAGYNRGPFITTLLADRLLSVSRFLQEGGLSAFQRACETRRVEEVAGALKGVRGVGPAVLRNFAILMEWE